MWASQKTWDPKCEDVFGTSRFLGCSIGRAFGDISKLGFITLTTPEVRSLRKPPSRESARELSRARNGINQRYLINSAS